MQRLALICAAGLLVASAARAADTGPDWAARPAGGQIGPVYPAIARQFAIEGHARLDCTVSLDGTAKACAVTAESPAGLGFGPAALALAPTFKLKPGPAEGASVEIPVLFKPARFPPPPTEARPAPTEAAVALARRIMAAQATANYLNNRYGQLMVGLAAGPSDGVDRPTGDLGQLALAVAIQQAIPAHLEASAQAYASYQSPETLEANVRFSESKSGAAYRALTPRIGPYEDALARNAIEATVATATCPPTLTCAPPAPPPVSPVLIPQPTATARGLAAQIAASDLPATPIPPGKLKVLIGSATRLNDAELQALATNQWTRIQGLAADAYAHQLDEDELREVLAFKTSAAGQALRQSGVALGSAMRLLERKSMQGALDAAAVAFCRQRTCRITDPPPAKAQELEAVVVSAAPYGL